jgi:hypothetical protein
MQPKLLIKEQVRVRRCLVLQISTKPPVGCREGASGAAKLVVIIIVTTKIILGVNRTLIGIKLATSAVIAIDVNSIIVILPPF